MSQSFRRSILLFQILLFISALFVPLSISFQNTNTYLLEVNIALATHDEGKPHTGDLGDVGGGGDVERSKEAKSAIKKFCSGNPGTWFTNCIVERLRNIASRFLIFSGSIFDYFLWFTLDNTLLGSDFVNDAWSNVKDLANLAFILGLIWISFNLILGRGGEFKKLFIKLVVIAVVLNFSLFASRVMIDAGNITAIAFYDQITFTNPNPSIPTEGLFAPKDLQIKSVSGALLKSMNSERIFSGASFNSIVASADSKKDGATIWAIMLLLYIAITIMYAIAGWEIMKAAFTFVSRTIWLVILSIISPLAFVALFLPGGEKMTKKWFNHLLDRCFCLVIYLFLIWLLILMLEGSNSLFNGTTASEGTWKTLLMGVMIQFMITISLLKIAGKITKEKCEGGMGVGDMVTKGVMLGAGVATGGVGMLARGSIGKMAYKAAAGESALGKRIAASAQDGKFSGLVARRALKNIGSMKYGTSAGYKERQDRSADKRFSEANELENINKGTLKKKYTKANKEKMFKNAKGEDQRVYTDEQAEAKAKIDATKASRKKSDQLLQRRFTKTEDRDGMPDTGILAKMGRGIDYAAGGLTGASEEAYNRRTASEKKDIEKKAEAARLAREREEMAHVASLQNVDNNKKAVAAGEKTMEAIANENSTPEQAQEAATNNGEYQAFEKAIGTSYQQVISNDIDEETGKRVPVREFQGNSKEQFGELMDKVKLDLGTVAKDGAVELRRIREERKRQVESLEIARRDEKTERKELSILQEIAKDMGQNNEQTNLNDSRRSALIKAGVLKKGSTATSFDGGDNLLALRDKMRTSTDKLSELSGVVDTGAKEVNTSDQNIANVRKDIDKKTKDIYAFAHGAAKSQLKARSDARNASDISKLSDAQRAALAGQGHAESDAGFEVDARATDIGPGA